MSRTRCRSPLVMVMAGLLAALAAARTQAQPARVEAKRLYDEGMAHYAARRWTEAMRALGAAHAIDPRRETLFAQAQATRLAGDCATAVLLYQRFLATRPPPQQVAATQIALGRCAERVTPPPPPKPVPAAITAEAPPPPRWHQDRWGRWLVGGGAALLVPSAVLLALAFDDDGGPRPTEPYGDYDRRRGSAESRWRLGLAGAVAGTASIAAGAARYLSVAVDHRRAEVAFVARF